MRIMISAICLGLPEVEEMQAVLAVYVQLRQVPMGMEKGVLILLLLMKNLKEILLILILWHMKWVINWGRITPFLILLKMLA
ncbi:hypothetical protein D3C85_1322610 [compost metagenome]